MSTSGRFKFKPAVIKLLPMTLGNRIRSVRTAAGLSQTEVSDLINVTSQTISQWESNKKTPSRENIIKFANALGVSISALLQPDALPEQKLNSTLDPVRGLLSRGRKVPIISHADILVPDKFSIAKSIVYSSFPCGSKSFAIEVVDTSQEPEHAKGSILFFDPDRRSQPGDFVIAVHAGNTIMGILSYVGSVTDPVTIIKPINERWPEWRSDEQQSISVVAVKTEAHAAG